MENTLKAHSTILSMLISRGINNNEYITRIKKLTGSLPVGIMDALNLSKQDVRKYVDMMNTKYDIELFKLSDLKDANEPYDADRYDKLNNEQNVMHVEYKKYMSKINPLLSKQW